MRPASARLGASSQGSASADRAAEQQFGVVMPGDVILADDSGVLVLSVGEAESIANQALAIRSAGGKP